MTRKTTLEEFLNASNIIHNYKYNYSKVIYKSTHVKVKIICPVHGLFEQTPAIHKLSTGCPCCANLAGRLKISSSGEQFVEKSRKVHRELYDYSLVHYVNCKTLVKIICTKHGIFQQSPNKHLAGHGCILCGKEKPNRPRLTQKEFVQNCRFVHGNIYDYSLSEYKTTHSKVNILCSKHSVFSQTPASHFQGRGCPSCMRTGYNPIKTGYFYVLSCENQIKIGITNRSPQIRQQTISTSSGKDFILEYFLFFKDGRVPRTLESQLLELLRCNYNSPDVRHDGYTECFIDLNLNDLLSMITTKCCDILTEKET